MKRPTTFSVWIIVLTVTLVTALIPLDPYLSQAAQRLPASIVHFNSRITDFGRFRWMIYGSGGLAIVSLVVHRASLSAESAARARTAWRLFSYFFVTIAGASALVNLLKGLVGRARPELFAELGAYSLSPWTGNNLFQSFPSGHSAAVGSFFGAFAMLAPRFRPLFLAGALLIGVSRVIVGAHYPSDVAAGLLVGLWCAVMTAFLFARWNMLFRLDAAGWPQPKMLGEETRQV
ncbi:phosphatase PAP2 family protein [Rhizobium sp. ARZ01]|uniref:phosphatase PAP2 family protein n=1 Tax=Rhizobium sp. ARZ01 TaxID=2769313 RepID=UPI001783F91C|nr:phosphatase PAP2 family protein [Rhizobium sp. ARZ01]MBD9374599.1 phosphatase PAP2 family protein [Rhizobium sp. ARZ01]